MNANQIKAHSVCVQTNHASAIQVSGVSYTKLSMSDLPCMVWHIQKEQQDCSMYLTQAHDCKDNVDISSVVFCSHIPSFRVYIL